MKKTVRAVIHWENYFQNLKLAYRIWTSIIFSVVNDYYIWKDVWKKIFTWCLKKIVQAFFTSHSLPVWLPNLVLNHFFCSKRQINSEKKKKEHVKKCFYWIWRKSFEPFSRYSLPVSFLVRPTPLPIFRISSKPRNIIYTLIWYCI